MNFDYEAHLRALCNLRNTSRAGTEGIQPRLQWIMDTLDSYNIEYELDHWTETNVFQGNNEAHYYNIYVKGDSDEMIMAHHDVNNINSENCNDNSASIVNAIATKLLKPNVNVSFTDNEEFGGLGAKRTCNKINEDYFGAIKWVLNFELTAVGGKSFFIDAGASNCALTKRIMEVFPDTPVKGVPFHDGMIVRRNSIDSVVINPLPVKRGTFRKEFMNKIPEEHVIEHDMTYVGEHKYNALMDDISVYVYEYEGVEMDMSLLSMCHSMGDTVDNIANFDDMKEFVEEVVCKILT